MDVSDLEYLFNLHSDFRSFIINLIFLSITNIKSDMHRFKCTRVGTLIVATIYLQLIPNRYMFQSFTVLPSEANATKWFLHLRNQVEVTRA